MSTKVRTDIVRIAYANLLNPFSFNQDQEPKYSCTLMIPKTDKTTIKALKAAIQEAVDTRGAQVFGGKIPAKLQNTLKDADVDTNNDGEVYADKNPEYRNHFILTVSNKMKPQVVDRNLELLTSPEEVYSGMYARATVQAFCYSANGNKGVSFSLGNIQKLRDGEHFDGRTSAEDDFDQWDDDETDDLL